MRIIIYTCTTCTSLLPDLWPCHECLEKNCVGYYYGKVHVHVAQHVNSQMNNLGTLSIHKTSSYFMEFFNPENKKNPEDKQTCMVWHGLFCIESPVLYLHEKDSFRVNQQKVLWFKDCPDYSLMNIYTYNLWPKRLVVWGVDYLKCMWVHKLSYGDTMQFYLHDIRWFWDAYTWVLACPFSHTGMYKTAPTKTILRYN